MISLITNDGSFYLFFWDVGEPPIGHWNRPRVGFQTLRPDVKGCRCSDCIVYTRMFVVVVQLNLCCFKFLCIFNCVRILQMAAK